MKLPEGTIKMVIVTTLVIYAIRFLRNSNATVASLFPAGMGTTATPTANNITMVQ